MKNLIRFFLIVCMVISGTFASAQRALAAPARKTVLVLFPLQFTLPGYPAYLLAMQAIESEFGLAADLSLDMYVEYLDLSRFPGEAYQQQLLNLYALKYGQKPIDLVLVNNEMALTWWLKFRAAIAPGVPMVFYDVATERLPALYLPSDVTGVTGMADYVPTVNWVRRALPAIKEIVLVHGVGQADQDPTALFPVQALQATLRGQIEFTDLSNLPLAEIKQRVAALPQTSIVLYSVLFEDADGVKYRPFDVARELAAASSVPVISGYDHLIGTGTVGGYVYSIEQQTRDAARMGLRLLRGGTVSALPVVSNQSNRFIFDHLALRRFHIPLSALPPDSIVKNRHYSLWERYQPQIIVTGAAFAVLSLLVVFLLVVTRQLKQSEGNLRQSEAKYRSIFENAIEGIFQSTPQGRFLRVNPAVVMMFGYATAAEMIAGITNIGQQLYANPEDREKIIELLEKDGIIRDYEVEFRRKDGSHFWVLDNMYTVRDPDGAILYFEGALLDITERKRAEEQIRNALAEKEILLRELYHRTKNNMSIIIALLKLQSNYYDDERLQTAFTDIENRIGSMALVHQKLYEISDLSQINLKEYINDLIQLLMQSYGTSPERVSYVSDMEEILVLIDTAIPCGLVLNELICNALKYAFPAGRHGRIMIELRRMESGNIFLSVTDDGVGLPPGFDVRRDGQMGMQSIFALAELQLGAQVSFSTGQGVSCRLQFKDNRYQPRV